MSSCLETATSASVLIEALGQRSDLSLCSTENRIDSEKCPVDPCVEAFLRLFGR